MGVREILESGESVDLGKFLEDAKRLDSKLDFLISIAEEPPKETSSGKLAGIPITVKDCLCTKGMRTTAGSKILENYVPPFDATVISRVKRAGGIIAGKTAMDEFGFGTFGNNCALKKPKNPWDLERAPGGSASGAGVAAAVLENHIAIGESTGGSISAPASFTGTVGITPTYGLVPRYGLIDYANSCDKIGTLGKKVFDAALLLEVIAGADGKDATSVGEKKEYTKLMEKDVRGMRVGIPKEYMGDGVDGRVKKSVQDAISVYEKLGVKFEECSLPSLKHTVACYYIIVVSEASTNLSKLCGLRYGLQKKIEGNFNEYFSGVRTDGFGEEAKRRIMLGTYARMAGYRDKYYLKALQVRTLIIEDFKRAFKKYDALLSPTMPMLPPKFSEISRLTPIENYMADIMTAGPNLAGIPMVSMPCGFSGGLPIGMHLLADHFKEENALALARAYEDETKITDKRPEI